MGALKSAAHRAGRWYVRKICRSAFESQTIPRHNERPIEYRFALAALAESPPGAVLDVGTGTTSWPSLLADCGYVVSAIDNVRDYWTEGMVNRHWTVFDVDIMDERHAQQIPGKPAGGFDSITCISVLEHIHDHLRAVRNMVALLRDGGRLILTTPFAYDRPDPDVYQRPDALYGRGEPYICRSSSRAELDQWLACGLKLEVTELWRLFTGPVWATGERCAWEQAATERDPHQLGLFVFRKPGPAAT